MFLSLLCLPLEKQLELIGDVPVEGKGLVSKHGTNADNILWVLQEYYSGWFDEVSEAGAGKSIIALIESGAFKQVNYLDDFQQSKPWVELRQLAKQAIEQSGLEYWPIEQTIDFHESGYLPVIALHNHRWPFTVI